jgi:hypothetical protein
MTPRRTSLGRLTRVGRLDNRWATALAEPNPAQSLRLLLALTSDFDRHPKTLAARWVSFVATVLQRHFAPFLTGVDLTLLEKTGATVAAGSAGTLGLDEAWLSLIAARDARREYQLATALLTTLYWSTDHAVLSKAAIARQLATRGARAVDHQAVYVDHLATIPHPMGEPQIVAVLAGCLTVGFELNPGQIGSAGDLAGKLRAAGVGMAGVDLALGYRYLMVDRDPGRAAHHLAAAWHANRADRTALLGLLAAWVRTGDHDRVLAMARDAGGSAPPLVGHLATLSATLRWLDSSTVDGQPPATAAQLAALPIAIQAGEWLAYAIGRLHLVEGDATQAARVLVPLADRQPQWHYHAAWALLLLNDRSGIATRFAAARGSADRWTIGCLLIEADPDAATSVADELSTSGLSPTGTRVVEARVALAQRDRPEPLDVVPADATTAEVLETLRTTLAMSFSRRDISAMTAAMSSPVFRRLPLADQLLWSGLAELPTDLGRLLLEQAADGLGYARAALVLTVHDFANGAQAGRLDRLSWRTDPTIELVRGWADVTAGNGDAAVARFTALAAHGESRANHALGNLWLRRAVTRADFATAARAFRAAPDVQILLHCAELAADPDGSMADCAADWPAVGDASPWVRWMVALAALAVEPAAVDLAVCECLVTILDDADAPSEAAVTTVAFGLATAALSVGDADRDEVLIGLLGRLANRTGYREVVRILGIAAAGAARRRPAAPQFTATGAAGALVLAEHSLTSGDPLAAADHLRTVAPDHDLEARFCELAADLLQDRPAPADIVEPDADSRSGLAFRILVAASVAKSDPERGLAVLAPLLREQDLTGMVDLHNALPLLCAGIRRNQVPDYLVRLVRQARTAGDDAMDPAVLARCASAIGEHELAETRWRQAIGADDDTRPEYVAVLRHQAVAARRDGDDLRAAGILFLAARVAAGCPPDTLVPSITELELLRARLKEQHLTGKQREVANGEWAAMARAFIGAVAREDETRTLLCFARLESQVDATAAAGADLTELATRLVLEVCTARLLAHLFPNQPDVRERPGRLRLLEDAIERDPRLLFALLDDDRKAILPAWRHCLSGYGAAVPFLHALAVLYRERAIADPTTVDDLVLATTLWALLLSSAPFWQHLGARAMQDEAQLTETVARDLLATHLARGKLALAAGDDDTARAHLRCITNCGGNASGLVTTLGTFHVPFGLAVDGRRFTRVAAIAKDVLNDWTADVLRAAQDEVDNQEAIENLPEGVSKNYEGGIKRLEPFVRLGVPVSEVLRTGLEWYNSWSLDHLVRQERDTVRNLTDSAEALAKALIPLCAKGRGLEPANDALSLHFTLRGSHHTDPTEATREFKEALAWNPGNDQAQKLLRRTTSRELNMRAVDLANKSTESEKSFFDARKEIAARVALGRQIIWPTIATGKSITSADCACCGGAVTMGRFAIIASLTSGAGADGKVMIKGADLFWSEFEHFLCDSCMSIRRSISEQRVQAVQLCEEAVELDPTYEAAKNNLKELRRLL